MAGASAGFHENESSLSEELKNRHRALVSIMEELEAVDWYDQRVEATNDADSGRGARPQPRRGEGARGHDLEWLRRHDTKWDQHLRTYLFTDDDVLEIEEEAEHGSGGAEGAGDLGIGSLDRRKQPDEPPEARPRPHLRRRMGGDRRRSEALAHELPRRAASWSTSTAPSAGPRRVSPPGGPTPIDDLRRRRRPRRAARAARWSSCASRSRCPATELDAVDRGARDVDLDPVVEAAATDRPGRGHRSSSTATTTAGDRTGRRQPPRLHRDHR